VELYGETGDLDGWVESVYWTLPGGTISTEDAPSITLDLAGVYLVTYTAIDSDGLATSYPLSIEATKDGVLPPRIVSFSQKSAVVGVAYRYDDDGLPLATGGGPYRWSVGKMIGEELRGRPSGMEVDERTGEVIWTPTEEQAGDQPVTIMVQNVAGLAMQEFVITVLRADAGLNPADNGAGVVHGDCGCQGLAAPWEAGLGALLMVALLALRRRATPPC
jgi:hypothetical protein